MKKYFEFGVGNRHIVRTEYENQDGTEYEVKGIHGKIHFESLYIRMWIFKVVLIIDSQEGIKLQMKERCTFKIILGIKSSV